MIHRTGRNYKLYRVSSKTVGSRSLCHNRLAKRKSMSVVNTTGFSRYTQQIKLGVTQNWPALAGLAGLYLVIKAIKFIRADADLNLLSRRKLPQNAFEDKVVWITGASQGLGEELALQLSESGAYLVLTSRSLAKLNEVKQKLRGKHAKEAVVLPVDLTGPYEKLQEAASTAMEVFGRHSHGIHYLVHNAGASQRAAVEDASVESVDALYELNCSGTLRLNSAILPMLLEQAEKGHLCKLVVIGSMASQMPAPGQAVYAACKASIAAYFRTLHSELWSRGITVTLCHPGPIATGSGGQIRSLYGAQGLVTQAEDEKTLKKRLSISRVAHLILTAAYHGVDSCWIVQQPILFTAYLVHFWPRLGYWIVNKIGPARARGYKSGGGGYDYVTFMKKTG